MCYPLSLSMSLLFLERSSVFWELRWTCPSGSQVRHGAAQMGTLTGKGIPEANTFLANRWSASHMATLGSPGWTPSSGGGVLSEENRLKEATPLFSLAFQSKHLEEKP